MVVPLKGKLLTPCGANKSLFLLISLMFCRHRHRYQPCIAASATTAGATCVDVVSVDFDDDGGGRGGVVGGIGPGGDGDAVGGVQRLPAGAGAALHTHRPHKVGQVKLADTVA